MMEYHQPLFIRNWDSIFSIISYWVAECSSSLIITHRERDTTNRLSMLVQKCNLKLSLGKSPLPYFYNTATTQEHQTNKSGDDTHY